MIARHIFNFIQPGRFVKAALDNHRYVAVPEGQALDKIMQALRSRRPRGQQHFDFIDINFIEVDFVEMQAHVPNDIVNHQFSDAEDDDTDLSVYIFHQARRDGLI